jgi:transcriptional regulator with XRE-family HTH domain
MAALLGISQQTWSKYESGRLQPPDDVQWRIAVILGVPRNHLWPGWVGQEQIR